LNSFGSAKNKIARACKTSGYAYDEKMEIKKFYPSSLASVRVDDMYEAGLLEDSLIPRKSWIPSLVYNALHYLNHKTHTDLRAGMLEQDYPFFILMSDRQLRQVDRRMVLADIDKPKTLTEYELARIAIETAMSNYSEQNS
jgi:hypothetical protein